MKTPLLEIVVSHAGERRYFSFPESEVSIGSGRDNDWVLPFPGVSRRHAWAVPAPEGIVLRDARSKNGLRVRGQRHAEIALRVGIEVELGLARLWLRDLSASDPIVPLASVAVDPEVSPVSSSTPELFGPDNPGLPAALALARNLGALGSPRSAERERFLERLRDVLGARIIVVGSAADRAGLAFGALIGDLPSDETLNALQAAVSGEMPRIEIGAEAWLVAATGARSTPWLAGLLPSHVAREEWRELLLVACGQALLGGSRVARESSGGLLHIGDVLRYPAEMVIGESQVFQQLLADVRATVGAGRNFLLLGETGTGKELFARLIHSSGPAASGPFVPCNVAEIPSELIESELFGITERAATGVDARAGLFREADGGTLFLDEIGELPMALQSKLLRVLQEREVRAVGARAATRTLLDVRIIAATNRDLLGGTPESGFRRDLYYRLAVIVHRIPALRERPGDIPTLVLALTERLAVAHGKRPRGVRTQTLRFLAGLPWPGNVRQLENELTRALLVCPNGEALGREHFPRDLDARMGSMPAAETGQAPAARPLPRIDPVFSNGRVEQERQEILDALRRSGGSLTEAARLLGITRQGLFKRRRRLGLK